MLHCVFSLWLPLSNNHTAGKSQVEVGIIWHFLICLSYCFSFKKVSMSAFLQSQNVRLKSRHKCQIWKLLVSTLTLRNCNSERSLTSCAQTGLQGAITCLNLQPALLQIQCSKKSLLGRDALHRVPGSSLCSYGWGGSSAWPRRLGPCHPCGVSWLLPGPVLAVELTSGCKTSPFQTK